MGTKFISRNIPLNRLHYFQGYHNADENVNLLQACYENPLFEEDGAVVGDTHTKIHGDQDGGKLNHFDIHRPAQTTVHYRQTSSGRKKRLYTICVILLVVVIIAIITAVLIGNGGSKGSSETNSGTNANRTKKTCRDYDPSMWLKVLYRTHIVDGILRIYKGPFSVYKPEYADHSSTLFSLFKSSFTYQMDSIFNHSAEYSSSFSHSEIVNISSGSVVVAFSLKFRRAIDVYQETKSHIASVIVEGLHASVFVIDASNIIVDPALSVITTPTPGVCEPITSLACVNYTDWYYTTFPNVLGHHSSADVMLAESQHQELVHYGCGRDFWCAVFNPPCHRNKALPPCRSYCEAVFASCASTYHHSNIHALLDCSILPNSEDPDICIPDPFKADTCLPHEAGRCSSLGYSEVMFPNFAGDRSPYQAAELIEVLAGINFATQCYKHAMLFTCSALMPNCVRKPGSRPKRIPPCKSLCQDFRAGCEVFMNIFYNPWPEQLYCDSFPDVDDPNICIGYKEAHEPIKIDECAVDETRCDNTTCIPIKWKCDDYNDCKDGSDEAPLQTSRPLRRCAVCPEDMFRCTPKSTICVQNTRRCDGIEDCPTGSDEQECVKLGGGGSKGLVQVYNPDSATWQPVCMNGISSNFSQDLCYQLGYQGSVSTTSINIDARESFAFRENENTSDPLLVQSSLRRSGQCDSNKMVVINCDIQICGIRPAYVAPSIRIVGGDLADPDAWPWQVSMYGGVNKRYFCGGSIIADRWILTASHCIGGRTDTKDMLLRAGQPRRDTYSPYLQELHPETLFLYPQYNPNTVDNDLALIKTKETIRFNDHVRPVCLPQTSERVPVGTRCTVIGWGKNNESAFIYQRELKQVYLEIVDQTECKQAIEGAKRPVPYRLNDHMICAGGGLGHDACSGDSGGPLLCPMAGDEDRWYVGGVVSWGVGCAYPNVPGVYSNIPGYLDWIRNTTGLNYL